jgi:two-component system CheB/CheR fusion protein
MTHKKDAPKSSPSPNDPTNTQDIDANKIITTSIAIDKADFPIVGIGASAGGLAAFEAFFSGMPANQDPEMAFILVQHLAPDHKSILTQLIQHYTRMVVSEVEDGMEIQVNHTYIIPPNRDMAILNGKLQLLTPSLPHGQRFPIDFFFRSLALDQHEQAIGIILSGTGSDGTLGSKAIKAEGGVLFAQELTSAEFDGMPLSIINTGLVDYILPPQKMAAQIINYVKQAFIHPLKIIKELPLNENNMNKIFILLRHHTGHDFSLYKASTIARRIERRMLVQKIDSIDSYVKYLQTNSNEIDYLFNELLIGVTNFFRDAHAFEALEKKIIPALFTKKSLDKTIRIWTPACSTGEEAYSIAILIQEYMDLHEENYKIQIFATDIDRNAIAMARSGIYPSAITLDVSPKRIERFFSLEPNNTHFRIKKNIRNMVIFSEHSIIKDPPFSKMDLISCRNLLIYLDNKLQNKIIPLFHYSLVPGGILFLGSAETIGNYTNNFKALDAKAKIYQTTISLNKSVSKTLDLDFTPSTLTLDLKHLKMTDSKTPSLRTSLREITEKVLLEDIVPTSVLINAQGDILYLHGRSGMFLEPAPGESGINNIHKMAREGLKNSLSISLRKAIKTASIVYCSKVQVKFNNHFISVDYSIRPVSPPSTRADLGSIYLITFEEKPSTESPTTSETSETSETSKTSKTSKTSEVKSTKNKDFQIAELKKELALKEEFIQTFYEEMESANEKLKSSNEEMQSVNEELQSTNEELETSKEELQSVNEELGTVNSELQAKLTELSRSNNDMNNLLAGTGIATIFLDLQLRILRFTSASSKIMNIISSDIGRPVNHLALNLLNYDNFLEDTQSVMSTLTPIVSDVIAIDKKCYTMRIQPYRTIDNVIEGLVITFVDITDFAKSREELRRLAVIIRDTSDAVISQDLLGNILSWNPAAVKLYGWSEKEALRMKISNIIPDNYREKELSITQRLSVAEVLTPYQTERLRQDGTIIAVTKTPTALVNEKGVMYAISSIERALSNTNA